MLCFPFCFRDTHQGTCQDLYIQKKSAVGVPWSLRLYLECSNPVAASAHEVTRARRSDRPPSNTDLDLKSKQDAWALCETVHLNLSMESDHLARVQWTSGSLWPAFVIEVKHPGHLSGLSDHCWWWDLATSRNKRMPVLNQDPRRVICWGSYYSAVN